MYHRQSGNHKGLPLQHSAALPCRGVPRGHPIASRPFFSPHSPEWECIRVLHCFGMLFAQYYFHMHSHRDSGNEEPLSGAATSVADAEMPYYRHPAMRPKSHLRVLAQSRNGGNEEGYEPLKKILSISKHINKKGTI